MRRKIPLLIVICLIAFAIYTYAQGNTVFAQTSPYNLPSGSLGCVSDDGSCETLGLPTYSALSNSGFDAAPTSQNDICNVFKGARQNCCNIAQERSKLFLFFEPDYCFLDYMNGDYQLVRP
jgi:hypothetical protein